MLLTSTFQAIPGRFSRWFLSLSLAGLLGTIAGRAQTDSDGFNPNLNGVVNAVVVQPDGKIIMGGGFTSARPGGGAAVGRNHVVRYLPDGSLDQTFDPNLNGPVHVLVLQPDGRILVGGRFSTADPNRTGFPVARNGLLRLNANGTLDPGFNPNPGGERPPEVFALAVGADGSVVVGGRFDHFQPGGSGTAVTRRFLARINANGSLDGGFDPSPNNIVYALGIQGDGRIVVGGGFTQMQPGGAGAVTVTGRIARLQADGSIDTGFSVATDDRVRCLAFEANGSLIIGGDFRSVSQGASGTSVDRLFLARIQANGTVDGAFRPNANAGISALAIQKDGRILVAGGFTGFLPSTAISTIPQRYLARINPDGSLDSTFNPGPNYRVNAVAVAQDGSVVAGGSFTRFRPASSSGSINRNRAARIYPDGSLDAASSLDAGGSFEALARFSDGRILAAGDFSSAGGLTRRNLVRLSPSGIVDNDFLASTNGTIRDVAIQSDGKIVLAGEFSQVNETIRQGIARLNADGSLDAAFEPSPNAPIYSLALAGDGKIFIGGAFTSLNPNRGETVAARNYLARLNADGTPDAAYNPGFSAQIESIALQGDGKLLVGGLFTFVLPQGQQGSVAGNHLVRLNTDGTLDTPFQPNPNDSVEVITVQDNGQILIGGRFTTLQPVGVEAPVGRRFAARLDADGTLDDAFDPGLSDLPFAMIEDDQGRILIGGRFISLNPNGAEVPVYRDRLVRLLANGSVDTGFSAAADSEVFSLLPEGNGDVVIGGSFSGLVAFTGQSGSTTGSLARLRADGNLDFAFSIRAENTEGSEVASIVPQGDGTLLVGGTFADLGGGANQNLARLFSDGNVDSSFSSRVNGPVHALLSRPNREADIVQSRLLARLNPDGTVAGEANPADLSQLLGQVLTLLEQPDGKLVAGGSFTDGNGQLGPYLVRFNPDGSVDPSFRPITNGPVFALALASDGRLLIGGSFTLVNGTARNRMARLDSNGVLDSTFNPNVSNQVSAIAVQSDGKILIGGSFSSLQPNGAAAAITRSRLARLNADGTIDAGFDPAPNDRVLSLAIEADGRILIGGDFTSLAPGGVSAARRRLARVNGAGELDSGFSPEATGIVSTIVVQADGRIVIGGGFTSLIPVGRTEAVDRRYLARINADGTLDEAFDPAANASVIVIHRQADEKLLVGGSFTSFSPNGSEIGLRRNRIARLNTDGTIDSGFNPNADGSVSAILVRADGTISIGGVFSTLQPGSGIFLGGSFSAINGVAVRNLARVNVDGTPDTTFNPDPDRPVDGLVLQADGRILVIGQFSQIAGALRERIARLDPSGSLEAGFNPNANGSVHAAGLQPDGKIVVGGAFTGIGGSQRLRLARLNGDGSVDAGFRADANGTVRVVAVQPNGAILVGGSFTEIGGVSRSRLARINADGTVDADFNPNPDDVVHSIAIQTDGAILVAGAFTSIGGASRGGVARLNTSGALDSSFRADADSAVRSVILLDNGRPFLGGGFTQVGGQARFLTARLNATSAITDRLSVDGSLTRVSWTRDGPLPEITAAFFALSSDGIEWHSLGTGERNSGGNTWTVDLAESLPAAATYFVRVEGVVPTTTQSSTGIVRSVAQFYGDTPAGPSSLNQSADPSGADDPSGDGDGSDQANGGSGTSDDDGEGAPSGGTPTAGASLDWSGVGGQVGAAFTNLSARVPLAPGRSFVTGFSVTGTGVKSILVRGVGPGLAGFGVENPAPAPHLEVLDADGRLVAGNSGWSGDTSLSARFASVGAFPLSPTNPDAALEVALPPGIYTIRLSDAGGLPGVVLAEIYDLDPVPDESSSRLVNLSSRGPVSIGSGAATGGFSVAGEAPVLVLVRAIGPGLADFGVAAAIADPVLRVYDSGGTLLAVNDDWGTPLAADALHPAYSPAVLLEAGALTGAFDPSSGSRDAIVLVEVEPGSYTVQARSGDGTSGETMIEVYLIR